ncbi:hypothetical protein MSG28_013097 [Choristoneura fumiferana]|uniref:Uncharacterized protein n=1 Tax=Choristoneura fumiferana TaxID=7141 RepID=A0ACC0KSH1_CHOFU|nr:hypothetical protein MSG28_013097 [Choristoneura fumiferana]
MSQRDTAIHLLAGGVAGTAGAVVTCPLEVVKTRLQSSKGVGAPPPPPPSSDNNAARSKRVCSKIPKHQTEEISVGSSYNVVTQEAKWGYRRTMGAMFAYSKQADRMLMSYNCQVQQCARAGHARTTSRMSLIQCIRHIVQTEGPKALFKGLGPNIVGVAPSRAIYFCTYSQAKAILNQNIAPDTPIVHLSAASAAASYMGISETVVHFVLYEGVKARLMAARTADGIPPDQRSPKDFLETRLREEGDKYRKFWQTLHTVWMEEGYRGVYRGLGIQLVRQIPNTAIMMSTYEAVVYLLTTHFNSSFYENT